MPTPAGGPDRSYKRGAVMGLTVAEAFILLAFCLLLLFTWWQIDTESRSVPLDPATPIGPEQRNAYSRFLNAEDGQRLMENLVRLDPETRLRLSDAIEATDAMVLGARLQDMAGDSPVTAVANRLQDAAREQQALVGLLNDRLGDQIRGAGGSIDGRGAITLPQAVLFDIGSDVVRDPGFLRRFCTDWIDTLRRSGADLSDVRIEGHASSEGPPGSTEQAAYLYNLDLSQRRAQRALTICLSGARGGEASQWAQARLAAIGYSSARLIRRPDGSENRDASRRVMFSVAQNQEKLIEGIRQDVTTP